MPQQLTQSVPCHLTAIPASPMGLYLQTMGSIPAWAAWYITRLLFTIKSKGVVFSDLFFLLFPACSNSNSRCTMQQSHQQRAYAHAVQAAVCSQDDGSQSHITTACLFCAFGLEPAGMLQVSVPLDCCPSSCQT